MNFLATSVVFSDTYVWDFILQLVIIFGALFIGNVLRNCIPLLKKMLIPSSLIGGVLVLLLKFIPDFNELIDVGIMQIITYHCLGLGFVAMTLRTVKTKKAVSTTKVVESGVIMASSYLIQAIIGLIISLVFFSLSGTFFASGLILPMGFGQGTGSALSWGSKYETSYGFTGGSSYGLAVATIGFIVGSVIGVIFLNILRKKGKLKERTSKNKKRNVREFVEEGEIPDTESVDKLSIQACMVAIVYFCAYGFMKLLQLTGVQAINDLAWGLNFLWALLFAMFFKVVLSFFKKNKAVKRNYINNFLMERISGFMFDIMIIAGVIAIEFEDIKSNILLLTITCVIGTVITFIYVYYSTKHTYKNYETESFLTNFGTVTGTASTGMILLREIDPDYVTPASKNIVLQNIPSIPLLAPLLLTLNFAATSLTNTFIMLGIYILLFTCYNIFLFRRKIFKGKYKNKKEEIWEEDTCINK